VELHLFEQARLRDVGKIRANGKEGTISRYVGSASRSFFFQRSSSLPSHFPNPPSKVHNIFSLKQLINSIPVLSQFIIRCNSMHKAMTGSTDPRYIIELIFRMPAPLQSLRM
jgi:hypothetical protein